MANNETLNAGLGLIARNAAGDVIEVFYPSPIRGLGAASLELIVAVTGPNPDKSGDAQSLGKETEATARNTYSTVHSQA